MKTDYFRRSVEELLDDTGSTIEFAFAQAAASELAAVPVSEMDAIKSKYTAKVSHVIRQLLYEDANIRFVSFYELNIYIKDLKLKIASGLTEFLQQQQKHFEFSSLLDREEHQAFRQPSVVQVYKPFSATTETGFSHTPLGDNHTQEPNGLSSKNPPISQKKVKNLSRASTKVLNQWFNHNVANPYPSEEEKQMLMSRTSLTRRQIDNWFINSRARKLKALRGAPQAKGYSHEL